MTPTCPECNSAYTYIHKTLCICSQCAHEWSLDEKLPSEHTLCVKDAYGTLLNDGDTVSVIKDLKIKGSSQVVKVGTKAKNIRLLPGEDHDIDCKIEGFGSMKLKSEFVKKA